MPNNVVHSPSDEKHWEEAKQKVKEEYPEKKGEDFYKITMSIYKNMTKSASGEELIQNLRKEGAISKNAVDKYREEHQYISIVSKLFTPQEEKVADANYMKNVGQGILIGTGTLAAGAGIAGAAKGIQRFMARRRRPSEMKDIIKYSPIVREMDPEMVNEGMRTLEDYNPEMAKHPLIAGGFLKSLHFHGGMTPEMANILKGDSYTKDITQTLSKGIESYSKRETGPSLQDLTRAGDMLGRNKSKSKEYLDVKDKVMKRIHASESDEETKEASTAGDVAKAALITGGAVAGLAGVGKIGGMLYNSATRGHRIEKVKEFSPELKSANPKFLNAGMKTLERLSPQVSKDPIAAASFLKQIIKHKGLNTTGVKDIVETANKEYSENPFLTAGKAFGKDL